MNEKLTKLLSKKTIYFSVLVIGFIFVILITIFGVEYNSEKFNFETWLSNTLITTAIAVFGIVIGELFSIDRQMENATGLYQKNLKRYNDIWEEVKLKTIHFSQFYVWYSKRELREKKINYLIVNNIPIESIENIMNYLSIDEVDKLLTQPLKIEVKENDFVYFSKLDKSQVATIKKVLNGEVKLDAPPSAYFLSAFATSNCKSHLETGRELDRAISINKKVVKTMKIITSLIISILWATLTVNEFMKLNDIQAWVNLLARIFALGSGFLTGFMSGVADVVFKARKLDNKVIVLETFLSCLNDGLFTAQDTQEVAKKEFEKYVESSSKVY